MRKALSCFRHLNDGFERSGKSATEQNNYEEISWNLILGFLWLMLNLRFTVASLDLAEGNYIHLRCQTHSCSRSWISENFHRAFPVRNRFRRNSCATSRWVLPFPSLRRSSDSSQQRFVRLHIPTVCSCSFHRSPPPASSTPALNSARSCANRQSPAKLRWPVDPEVRL